MTMIKHLKTTSAMLGLRTSMSFIKFFIHWMRANTGKE